MAKFENWLLQFNFCKQYAEVICIKCIKKTDVVDENNLISGDYSSSFNKVVYSEISANSNCLDVGCWTGNLGKALIEKKNCTVDGMDFRDDVLKYAKEVGYHKTFKLNLNSPELDFSLLGDTKYDFIIFADVLEHLINPDNILHSLKNNLTPDGNIIISLPNVAFLLNRILLLFGRWNYKEFGTLDKTHLKFYTIDSAIKMIEKTGFKIVKIRPYNQFVILKKLHPLEHFFPRLLAYQFLIKAK